jgi:hypothetical protein
MWDVPDYMGAGEQYDLIKIPVVRIKAMDALALKVGTYI